MKDYCPGYWDLATGGVVDAGEDDDEGASREIEEELGLPNLKPKRATTYKFTNDTLFGNLYYLELDSVNKEMMKL